MSINDYPRIDNQASGKALGLNLTASGAGKRQRKVVPSGVYVTSDIFGINGGKMEEVIKKLKGANMDIDLATPKGEILWDQDECPWNKAEKTDKHRCAVKNVSICGYFCGVEYIDTLLCCYPHPNPFQGAA